MRLDELVVGLEINVLSAIRKGEPLEPILEDLEEMARRKPSSAHKSLLTLLRSVATSVRREALKEMRQAALEMRGEQPLSLVADPYYRNG
jgi:NifB/MoaA-like Fe-S oxidoreductase